MIAQLISPEARLRTLENDFRTFVEKHEVLRSAAVFNRLAAVLPKLDEPVAVSFVGDFNTGKSSTLNAIVAAGRALSPVDPRPAGALTCYFRYGDRERVRFVRRDGAVEETTFDEFGRIVNQQAETPASVAKRNTLSHAEVFYPAEILREVVLVDTPGLGSISQADDERALEHIAQADALCWLFDANTGAVSTETLGRIRRALPRVRAAWAVVNRCDDRAPSERRAVVQGIHREVGRHFRQVFGYSARLAALQATGRPLPADETTGLDLRFIDQIIAAVREETRELRVARAARELAAAIEVALQRVTEEQSICEHERAYIERTLVPSLRKGGGALRGKRRDACDHLRDELETVMKALESDVAALLSVETTAPTPRQRIEVRSRLVARLHALSSKWRNATCADVEEAGARIQRTALAAQEEAKLRRNPCDPHFLALRAGEVPHHLGNPVDRQCARVVGGLDGLLCGTERSKDVRTFYRDKPAELSTYFYQVADTGRELRELQDVINNEAPDGPGVWATEPYATAVRLSERYAEALSSQASIAKTHLSELTTLLERARALTGPARA